MTDRALTVRDDLALEGYGDLAEVREMTKRLLAMLPSAKDLGPAGAGALAQASLAMGLNPFIGEIWAIPQGPKNRDGTYNTYAIMVGIKGLRHKAHDQAKDDRGMYHVYIRPVREEEIEGWQRAKGDVVRACDLTVTGQRAIEYRELTGKLPTFTGIGIYRNGERTKMSSLQVARKRAEADAIKQAFDVPLSFVTGPNNVSIEIENDLPERYEENGDALINGHSGDANDTISELFEDYDQQPTGDVFLNGDYHGAPPDETTRQDLKEGERALAEHQADVDEAKREIGDLEESPHWIDDPTVRKRFWAWAGGTLGLDDIQVHTALGVEHVRDFAGTMGDAKTAILNWNAAQKKAESAAQ